MKISNRFLLSALTVFCLSIGSSVAIGMVFNNNDTQCQWEVVAKMNYGGFILGTTDISNSSGIVQKASAPAIGFTQTQNPYPQQGYSGSSGTVNVYPVPNNAGRPVCSMTYNMGDTSNPNEKINITNQSAYNGYCNVDNTGIQMIGGLPCNPF